MITPIYATHVASVQSHGIKFKHWKARQRYGGRSGGGAGGGVGVEGEIHNAQK